MNSPTLPARPGIIAMPMVPKTASPVPSLTSIHSVVDRGPYGDRRYRGNCGGYLIRDLLKYFKPRSVLDPMTGSGTCRDVCRELSIPVTSFDLKSGDDAGNSDCYESLGKYDFIWLHPPYWRMIRYGDDPRCLSQAPTLEAFLDDFRKVIVNCRNVLSPRGRLTILIGGYCDRGRQVPLPVLTTILAMEEGLWPACTEIIRFQHGNTSSRKSYQSSFIPGLHDTCTVFRAT